MRLARPLAVAALTGAALLGLAAPANASGLAEASTCPSGTQGVVVKVGSSTTMVCTSAVADAVDTVGDIIVVSCEICRYIDDPIL